MTKQIFQDLPNTTTPINAANLNKLNNLAIDTTVGTHEEEAILLKSNNLLKLSRGKNTFIGTSTIFNENQYFLNMTADGGTGSGISIQNIGINSISVKGRYIQGVGFPIKCQASTQYTFKCNKTSSKARIGYSFYTENGTFIRGNSGNVDTFTVTTPDNAYWLITLLLVEGDNYGVETFTNIILNKGNAITSSINIPSEIYADKEKFTDTVNIGTDGNNAGLWVEHSKNYCNNIAKSYDIRGNGTYRYGVDLGYLDAGTYYLSRKDSSKTTVVYITEIDGTTYTDNAKSGTEFSFTLSKRVRCIARTTDNNASTWSNGVGKIMVERNNVKTTYEDYVNQLIKVNNNGIYEPIAYKNVYTSEEVVIGEWFGKPLYRKVINTTMGTCTTNGTYGTTNNYNVGDNVDIKSFTGKMKIDNSYFPLMYMDNSGRVAKILTSAVNKLALTTNGTYFSGASCEIVVEYTKTTDSGISTLSLD